MEIPCIIASFLGYSWVFKSSIFPLVLLIDEIREFLSRNCGFLPGIQFHCMPPPPPPPKLKVTPTIAGKNHTNYRASASANETANIKSITHTLCFVGFTVYRA